MFIDARLESRGVRSRRARQEPPFRAPDAISAGAPGRLHLRPHRLWRGGPVVHRQWVGEFLHPAVYVGLLPMTRLEGLEDLGLGGTFTRIHRVPLRSRGGAGQRLPQADRVEAAVPVAAVRRAGRAEPPAPRDVLRALPADARRLGERLLGTFQRLVQRLPPASAAMRARRARLAALALEGVVAAKELLAKRGQTPTSPPAGSGTPIPRPRP